MELVYVLRTLWERKWWVLGAFALAVLAAVYVRSDGAHFGVASQEVLLDAPSSALGDLGRDIEPLSARTGVFARVLMSQELVREIGRDAGIPVAQIGVQGPPLLVNGVPDQATSQGSEAAAASRRYGFSVRRGDGLPLLTVSTKAPTPDEARRLASATTQALVKLVERAQEESAVPDKRQLTIRVFGEAKAHEAIDQPGKVMMIAAFLGVLGFGCLVILLGPAVVAAFRTGDASREPLAAVGANGNGSRDVSGAPDLDESVDAILGRATRAANDARGDGALGAEPRPAGDIVLRDVVLRDLQRERDS